MAEKRLLTVPGRINDSYGPGDIGMDLPLDEFAKAPGLPGEKNTLQALLDDPHG